MNRDDFLFGCFDGDLPTSLMLNTFEHLCFWCYYWKGAESSRQQTTKIGCNLLFVIYKIFFSVIAILFNRFDWKHRPSNTENDIWGASGKFLTRHSFAQRGLVECGLMDEFSNVFCPQRTIAYGPMFIFFFNFWGKTMQFVRINSERWCFYG